MASVPRRGHREAGGRESDKTLNLRGYLDAMLSSGFIEGWACDDDEPLRPLTIAVLQADTEIARAVANIYRPDLAEAGCGTGWCAFRARLAVSVSEAQGAPLVLREVATGQILHEVPSLPELDIPVPPASSVEDIIAQDPTLLGDARRLKGCGRVLNGFIRQHSVEDFVSTAFLYVLQRPVDRASLEEYASLVRQGLLEPLNVLYDLADSMEYRTKPKALAAPCHPSFPFREV